MNKSINARPWTPAEDTIAISLRAEGKDNHEIGERLGRPSDGVRNRLYWLSKTEAERKEHSRTRKRAPKKNTLRVTPQERIPAEVFEERERRRMAPRSLTATICGDPEIGRSALCRKLEAAQ